VVAAVIAVTAVLVAELFNRRLIDQRHGSAR